MLRIMLIIKPALTRQVSVLGCVRAVWELSRPSFTSIQDFNFLKGWSSRLLASS